MDTRIIAEILESQYRASLGMLRDTIQKVPKDQWNTDEFNNPTWQIAYHVLWSVKFYLGPDTESYIPWENAIEGAESLGGSQDWENPDKEMVLNGFHTREDLLTFIEDLEDNLQQSIHDLPLDKDSGFEWYPYSRLELHINTIRHIQHHAAQIIERLKAKGITGFNWWADKNQPQEW